MKRINYRTMDIIREVTEKKKLYRRECEEVLKRIIIPHINSKFPDKTCVGIHNFIIIKTDKGDERRFVIDTYLNQLGVLYFRINELSMVNENTKKEIFRGYWYTPTEYSKKRESILSFFRKPKFSLIDHVNIIKDLKKHVVNTYSKQILDSL